MSVDADRLTAWNRAAAAYREARVTTSDSMSCELRAEIAKVGTDLDEFLRNAEGEAAMSLLRESDQAVTIASAQVDDREVVVGLTFNGLMRSNRGPLYQIKDRVGNDPYLVKITGPELVMFATFANTQHRNPEDLMRFLMRELDVIAGMAPKMRTSV